MRLLLIFVFALQLGCGGGGGSSSSGSNAVGTEPETEETLPEEEEILLPFQSYVQVDQSRGGECEGVIDTDAPIISNGFGFDLGNTRNQASIITSDNVANLTLNYVYSQEGVTEKRGAPAATAQAIFLTGGKELVAINRLSGCRYWRYTAEDSGDGFRSSAIIFVPATGDAPSLVYAGDFNGNVYAINAETGELVWRAFSGSIPVLHFITGGLQYFNGTLFVPVSSKEVISSALYPQFPCCRSHGMLVAFDALTGERRWEYHTTEDASEVIVAGQRVGPNGAPIWSTPTIDAVRNVVYVGTGQNYTEPTTGTSDAIIALDIDSGEVNWIFQATANDAWNAACEIPNSMHCPDPEGHDFDFGSAPIVVDDGKTLIAGDKGGMVYSINASDGSLNWTRKVSIGSKLGGIHWGMAVDDSNVYAAATDFEINKASGELSELRVGANPGIYALSLTTGELVWEIHPSREYEGLDTPVLYSAALSVSNDLLFGGSLDGMVRAFSVVDGRELWAYDTFMPVTDINDVQGNGATIDSVGVVIAGDGILVNSGYSTFLGGGVGKYQAGTGNSLFVIQLATDND
ncbi:MAG: PQQ-binding-like beta-propeller repeat protein [Halioglobus sp.]